MNLPSSQDVDHYIHDSVYFLCCPIFFSLQILSHLNFIISFSKIALSHKCIFFLSCFTKLGYKLHTGNFTHCGEHFCGFYQKWSPSPLRQNRSVTSQHLSMPLCSQSLLFATALGNYGGFLSQQFPVFSACQVSRITHYITF